MTRPLRTTPTPWRDSSPCCPVREPLLQVEELTVAYRGVPALRAVTTPIHRGCITAVVGPSGCGKSTFLNCLNRLTDLIPGCEVEGSVRLEGREILTPDIDLIALRRQVGMIFQKPNPFPLSIRRNLTFPLKQHGVRDPGALEAEVRSALSRVGLWEEVKDRLDAPALDLSGGQQQRLCLARALALHPQVLLLDEPCSALDPMAGSVVEELIASLRGQQTVIIVTHNLAQARRVADDVAVFWTLNGVGGLLERGEAREVFDSPQTGLTADYLSGVRG